MTYQLNKAISPGISVSAALEFLSMTQKNLADRTELTEKTISQIINGESSITVDTAVKFENVLGGSAAFWLALESQYKTTLLRLELEEKAELESSLAATFPYGELVKRGYVSATRDIKEKVQNLWKFFGVNSLSMIPNIEVAAYRRGYILDSDQKRGALAAWLRSGEIIASKEVISNLAEYDARLLRARIPEIKNMTQMKNPNFFVELQRILSEVGVGLVAVQYFPGTKASGATRWIGQNPIIQLSTYGKDADKIWFTLFHEIGHILLHGRKEQFISFTNSSKVPEEIEADEFAANRLISLSDYKQFINNSMCTFENSIRAFAESQGVATGIVVGRMKRDKILDYRVYPHLHEKLKISEKA